MLHYVIVGNFSLEEIWRIMEGLIAVCLLRSFGLSIFVIAQLYFAARTQNGNCSGFVRHPFNWTTWLCTFRLPHGLEVCHYFLEIEYGAHDSSSLH